jgi:hypothetical protein
MGTMNGAKLPFGVFFGAVRLASNKRWRILQDVIVGICPRMVRKAKRRQHNKRKDFDDKMKTLKCRSAA